MEPDNKLKTLLKGQGYSVTKPRMLVFKALLDAHEALTIAQIIDIATGVDTVSVYRTLQLFEKTGVVHRVWNGFKSKIELSEDFSPHHHHFTCSKCGSSVAIKSDELEGSLHALETIYGFDLKRHSVELSGYCAKCKKAMHSQIV
jgi:Fur family transcriptional regulator, ferric uptake regulator